MLDFTSIYQPIIDIILLICLFCIIDRDGDRSREWTGLHSDWVTEIDSTVLMRGESF